MRVRIAAGLCALGVALAISATPAAAITDGHLYDFEFGGLGQGAGQFESVYGFDIAIDQSTGDIYAADTEISRVEKFDSAGNFLLMWGYGVVDGSNELQVCYAPGPCQRGLLGNAPGQMEGPGIIVVDNSAGPNQGRVYVADTGGPFTPGRNVILKYSPSGAYEGLIDASESPGGTFQYCCAGLDVDGLGFVWASDGQRVMRFSNQPNNAYVGGSEFVMMSGDPPEPIGGSTIGAMTDGSGAYISTYQGLFQAGVNGGGARVVSTEFGGSIAINPSNNHVFLNWGETDPIQEYKPTASGLEKVDSPFGHGYVGGWITGIDVNHATGEVYVGAATLFPESVTGRKIFAFKPRYVPETITEPATAVRHTTATLEGHTTPDPTAGGDVSECYFEWGTTKTYEHKDQCNPGAPISSATQVTDELTGLLQEGTYHYRLSAKNSIDTQYGVDRTFTTHAVLGVDTGVADEITPAAARLHGSFDPDGLQTNYYFEWGRNEKLGESGDVTSVQDAGSAPGTTPVSQELEGLEDYTVYYYRLVATNSLGTSYGAKHSFRTIPPDPPMVSAGEASAVTGTTAHLSAVVKPNFGETIYGFEYGENSAYGEQRLGENLLSADGGNHPVSIDIGGLRPGQTYHYRVLAINFGGITYGSDQTFLTLDTPKVLSENATGISSSGARLNAQVHPSLSPTEVHFEYGPTEGYGGSTAAQSIGGGGSPVSAGIDVNGLAPLTTYHFRAVAANAIGTEVGPDQIFNTAAEATQPPEEEPKPCKRGFVKRHGRCVRRRRPKQRKTAQKHHSRHATRGHRRSAE